MFDFLKPKKSLEERLREVGVTVLAREPTPEFKIGHDSYSLSGSGNNEYDAESAFIKSLKRNGNGSIKYVEGIFHSPKPNGLIRVHATGYALKKKA